MPAPIIRCAFRCVASGQAIVNTFEYVGVEGQAAPDLAGFCDNFNDAVGDSLLSNMHTSAVNVDTVATVIFGDFTGNQAVGTGMTGQAGALAGTSAPLCNCAIFRKRTGIATRYGRGRIFNSPRLASEFNEVGEFHTSDVPHQLALTLAMNSPISDGTQAYQPCLFHAATPGVTLLTSVSVSPLMGIMRSRRERTYLGA